MIKQNKAITLIALIITVIVLLILAGVSINILFGQEGIFTKSTGAVDAYKVEQMKEEIELAKMEATMNKNNIGDQTFEGLKTVLEAKGFYVDDDGLVTNDKKYPGIAIEIDPETLEIGEEAIDLSNIVPTVSITSDQGDKITGSINLKIKASEIKNGLAKVTLKKEGESEYILEKPDEEDASLDKKYEKTIQITKNGTYILEATAKITGEKRTAQVVINKIDETIPSISFTQIDPQEGEYAQSVTYSIEKEEGPANKITQIEDSDGNKYTNKFVATESKEYKFIMKYGVGNETEQSFTPEAVDDVVDKLEITKNTDEELQASITLTIIAEDNKSGVSKIYLVTDDGEQEFTDATEITNGKQATYVVKRNGTYTFKAIDNLGNEKEQEIQITNIDEWTKLGKMAKIISNTPSINNTTQTVTVVVDGEEETINVGDKFDLTYKDSSYTVIVLGFNHDTLTTSTAYDGEETATGKAGISFQFETEINGGTALADNGAVSWPGDALVRKNFTSGNDPIVDKLSIKDLIKSVEKKTICFPLVTTVWFGSQEVLTSSDKLWLLSASEIWSGTYVPHNLDTFLTGKAMSLSEEGEIYAYYQSDEPSWEFVNERAAGSEQWMLRSMARNLQKE